MSAVRSSVIPSFDAVIVEERSDVERLRKLTLRERAELIEAACAAPLKFKPAGRKRDLRASAPWPASTWRHLAEWARRARQQQ